MFVPLAVQFSYHAVVLFSFTSTCLWFFHFKLLLCAWREKIRGNIASGPRTTSSPASSHVQQVKLLFIALTLTFRLPSSLRYRLQRPPTHPPLCSRCRKKLGGYQPPLDFPIYRAYSVLPGIYSEALTFGLPRRMTLSPTQTLGGPFPSPQVSVRAYTSNVVRFSI